MNESENRKAAEAARAPWIASRGRSIFNLFKAYAEKLTPKGDTDGISMAIAGERPDIGYLGSELINFLDLTI
jgi:hypothetical protein